MVGVLDCDGLAGVKDENCTVGGVISYTTVLSVEVEAAF
jgi:hypothetical protein